METTVTMSLSRYKELESKEIAMEKLINEPDKFTVVYGWNSTWRCVSHVDALKEIANEMEEIKRFAESWRQKAQSCK